MARTSIIVIALLIAQTISAPSNLPVLKNPASMSYEELEYILRVKRGEVQKPPKTISPCARAILGCCNNLVMNSDCSESLKCGAFFFNDNPCNEKFVLEALKAARNFYTKHNNVS